MKKNISLSMLLILLLLCGCTEGEKKNSQTRFLLDTVATIDASCDDDTLDGAFSLCADFEKKLSRTIAGSDVYRLNNTEGFVKVGADTEKIIERAVYYAGLSDGKFDITICPVSELWNFDDKVIPDRSEIAEALQNVDYHSIEIKEDKISLNGKRIDLGGIAKGYIADRLTDYLKSKGVKKALISLGGNVTMIGKYNVGIKKPFEDTLAATVTLENKSAVTSGIYERYIKKDGKIYHHVLDPATGYGAENNLASVTVLGKSSFDCDALSTVCLLEGQKKGMKIIENISDTEAVFIDRDGIITLSSGLLREGEKILYK